MDRAYSPIPDGNAVRFPGASPQAGIGRAFGAQAGRASFGGNGRRPRLASGLVELGRAMLDFSIQFFLVIQVIGERAMDLAQAQRVRRLDRSPERRQ